MRGCGSGVRKDRRNQNLRLGLLPLGRLSCQMLVLVAQVELQPRSRLTPTCALCPKRRRPGLQWLQV